MKRPPGRKEGETRAQREKYTQGGREENESERIAIHKTVGPHWPGSNISSVVTSKTSLTHKKEAKGRTNNLTGQVETANCSLGLGGPHPSPLLLRFCVYRLPYKKSLFLSVCLYLCHSRLFSCCFFFLGSLGPNFLSSGVPCLFNFFWGLVLLALQCTSLDSTFSCFIFFRRKKCRGPDVSISLLLFEC